MWQIRNFASFFKEKNQTDRRIAGSILITRPYFKTQVGAYIK